MPASSKEPFKGEGALGAAVAAGHPSALNPLHQQKTGRIDAGGGVARGSQVLPCTGSARSRIHLEAPDNSLPSSSLSPGRRASVASRLIDEFRLCASRGLFLPPPLPKNLFWACSPSRSRASQSIQGTPPGQAPLSVLTFPYLVPWAGCG